MLIFVKFQLSMTDFLNLDYAEQCSAAIVTLKNDVLASKGSLQGMYQISDPINGKPSWTTDFLAIWYWQGYWNIGYLSNIGTSTVGMFASDVYEGLDDANNQWYYWDGSDYDWILAGANDVNTTCTSNNIFFEECSSKNAD